MKNWRLITLGSIFLLLLFNQALMAKEFPDDIITQYQELNYENFNNILINSSGEEWTDYALLVTQRFLDCFKSEARNQYISVEHESATNPDRAKIKVIYDGYLDDSIRGSMYELILERKDDIWVITEAKEAFICWRGSENNHCK